MREMTKPSKKSIKNAISTPKKPFFTQKPPKIALIQKSISAKTLWRRLASLKLFEFLVKFLNKITLFFKVVMTSSSPFSKDFSPTAVQKKLSFSPFALALSSQSVYLPLFFTLTSSRHKNLKSHLAYKNGSKLINAIAILP